VTAVGDEHDLRAAQLELLDEVVELLAEDALLRTGRRGAEAGKQEHVVEPVRLRALHAFRLLRAVPGDRQHDRVARTGTLHQRPDRAQHRGTIGLRIDQRGDVARAHAAQRRLDVARIRDRAFQRPDVLVGIDADHERAHLAAVGAAQRRGCGHVRTGDGDRRKPRCKQGEESRSHDAQGRAPPMVAAGILGNRLARGRAKFTAQKHDLSSPESSYLSSAAERIGVAIKTI